MEVIRGDAHFQRVGHPESRFKLFAVLVAAYDLRDKQGSGQLRGGRGLGHWRGEIPARRGTDVKGMETCGDSEGDCESGAKEASSGLTGWKRSPRLPHWLEGPLPRGVALREHEILPRFHSMD